MKDKDRNIVIVVGTLGSLGGAERQAIYLAKGLKELSYNVCILSFGGGVLEQDLKNEGINYYVFKFNFLAPFKKKIIPLIRLTFLLRKFTPEAIIPFVTINSKYIGLIWKYTGARFACWNQRDEGREVFGTRLERFAIMNVPVVISNSLAGKEILMSKLGVIGDKIQVINNGVEIPTDVIEGVWKSILKIDKETIVVSMIASISKYKDHSTLLKGWSKIYPELRRRKRKAVLLFAGKDRGLTEALKIDAFDLRIAESVFFLGSIKNVSELIVDSDLIIHSSNTEGCPNAVLEAMSLKKTVVGTDISGIRQALGEKYSKYCYSKPYDYEDMAEKVLYLLDDEDLMREMALYNYRRIENQFSVEKMVSNYIDLFSGK